MADVTETAKAVICGSGVSDSVPNCNCTKTLLSVSGLRSDTEEYKSEALVIHCVLAGLIAILVVCVVGLFYWVYKLQRLVTALDPMSKYKKVGPSIYIKKARRETTSISSSFKHFNGNMDNNIYSNVEDVRPNENGTAKISSLGTLDRNFFTDTNFSFHNPLSQRNREVEEDVTLNRRRITDPEVREAVAKLDKVIY